MITYNIFINAILCRENLLIMDIIISHMLLSKAIILFIVLPSINSLKVFGLVQLEAMQCGTPVIASDLPGVRTIVKNTNMGMISKKNDPNDLAKKIIEVLNNRNKFIKNKIYIEKYYSNEVVANKYISIFERIKNENN